MVQTTWFFKRYVDVKKYRILGYGSHTNLWNSDVKSVPFYKSFLTVMYQVLHLQFYSKNFKLTSPLSSIFQDRRLPKLNAGLDIYILNYFICIERKGQICLSVDNCPDVTVNWIQKPGDLSKPTLYANINLSIAEVIL